MFALVGVAGSVWPKAFDMFQNIPMMLEKKKTCIEKFNLTLKCQEKPNMY
jgi:hypothetical protein